MASAIFMAIDSQCFDAKFAANGPKALVEVANHFIATEFSRKTVRPNERKSCLMYHTINVIHKGNIVVTAWVCYFGWLARLSRSRASQPISKPDAVWPTHTHMLLVIAQQHCCHGQLLHCSVVVNLSVARNSNAVSSRCNIRIPIQNLYCQRTCSYRANSIQLVDAYFLVLDSRTP